MVNLKSLSRFLAQVLIVVMPLLGLVFLCSLITTLLAEQTQALDRLGTWQFWAAVGLGVLTAAMALTAAYLLAARWVQALYGLQNLGEGREFVERQLFGLKGFAPWFRLEEGEIAAPKTHVLRQVGGPGNFVLSLDTAAILERAGILTKMVYPRPRDQHRSKANSPSKGKRRSKATSQPQDQSPLLGPFERVFTTLDLRPRRQIVSVAGMSYEGIPMKSNLEIHYQIRARRDTEGHELAPTQQNPFPASPAALFWAARAPWIREAYHGDERVMDWGERLAGVGMGALRGQLARYRLDELVGLVGVLRTESDNEIVDARTLIRKSVDKEMRRAARCLGARVLRVEIGDIHVEDAVTQQWVDTCKAQWTRRAAERQILGKAQHVGLVERARNEAMLQLLDRATEVTKDLTEGEQKITAKLVLSRLFMVLSSTPSDDALARGYLPGEFLKNLEKP